jgi:RNA polymerase sigma-70 factor (ECF subfamily)
MKNIVNEDLCLEAFALTKLLFSQHQFDSTSNLLALFCFHIARIPAKIDNGKLISFFNQNREKWNKELLNLGFHYLKKPKEISKFYLEAIIISKYISISQLTKNDWIDIVKLYEMMQKFSQSPIVKLNYCFCLSKIGKTENALLILSEIERELPNEHLYFSLVKAKILKEINPKESDDLFVSVMNKMNQKIRKEYLLENELIRL